MNERRIGLGMAAWVLGILVPVGHHIALHAAIAHGATNNIVTRMQSVFEFLPWIDWVYLALMFGLGAILIVSGLGVLANLPLPRPRPGPRGFEVISIAESGRGQ